MMIFYLENLPMIFSKEDWAMIYFKVDRDLTCFGEVEAKTLFMAAKATTP